MPIETTCPGCGRRLSVHQDHAGRQAQCPECGATYQVSKPVDAAQAGPDDAPDEASVEDTPPSVACWLLTTPEGQTYGPVTREELDGWVAQGRVTADCLIQQQGETGFLAADHFYAAVREVPTARPAVKPTPPKEQAKKADRGLLILLLGLMAYLSCCPVMSVIAWILGVADLQEMRAGRMDSQNMGLTQAGQILGMIHTVLWITGLVIWLFVLLLTTAY